MTLAIPHIYFEEKKGHDILPNTCMVFTNGNQPVL